MKKLNDVRVVFLGAGNMAEALVRGLLKGHVCPASHLTVTDIRPERLAYFQSTFGVAGATTNAGVAAQADVLFLAVKPQQLREVVTEVAPHLPAGALILSIAAGVRTATLEALLGSSVRVVRAMPNTPALVSAGVTAICPGAQAGEAELALAEALLRAVGSVVRVEEPAMDAVTAVSGSGPAYVFHFMEALLAGAEQLGLEPALARQLVYGTLAGAIQLAQQSPDAPGLLRERVTSKGGTTAAALEVVNTRAVAQAWIDALAAAQRRSVELSGG